MRIEMAKKAVPPTTPPTIPQMAVLESPDFGATFVVVDVGVELELTVVRTEDASVTVVDALGT
jgi:hypothetical protein